MLVTGLEVSAYSEEADAFQMNAINTFLFILKRMRMPAMFAVRIVIEEYQAYNMST